MRSKVSILTVIAMIVFTLWAFSAVAQDATLTPTTDPAMTDPGAVEPTATIEGTQMVLFASAAVADMSGNEVGSVVFTSREDGKVLVTASFADLPPGIHGMHIHDVADCTVETPHYNPTGEDHPHHAGDLAALFVNRDGTAFMTAVTDRFTIEELLAGEGTKLNVHALPDNYAHIPARYGSDNTDMAMAATPDPAIPGDTGNAADEESRRAGDSGSPIACGEIEEGFMAILPVSTATPEGDTGGGTGDVPTPEMTATLDGTADAPGETAEPGETTEPGETVEPGETADPTEDVPVDPTAEETVDPDLTPVATLETAIPPDPTETPADE